jgi:hypothetical protein
MLPMQLLHRMPITLVVCSGSSVGFHCATVLRKPSIILIGNPSFPTSPSLKQTPGQPEPQTKKRCSAEYSAHGYPSFRAWLQTTCLCDIASR